MVAARIGPVDARTRRYVELSWVLVRRYLSVRYRGSSLGVFWSMANPLLMTGLYTLLFGSAFAVDYGGSVLNYVLAVFVGLSVVVLFAGASSQALVSIVGSGAILNKIKVPPMIFPVSQVLANTFQFAIGTFPLLVIVCLLHSHNPLNAIALLVPTIALVAVCMGTGLILSTLYVFFRDMQYLWEFMLTVFWMTSPVFYPERLVPAAVKPFIHVLNPLVSIIASFRQITLSRDLPDAGLMAQSLLGGAVVLTIGYVGFRIGRRAFMDLI